MRKFTKYVFVVVFTLACISLISLLLVGLSRLVDNSDNRVIKVSCYSNNELKYLKYTKHVSISGDSIKKKPLFDKCILEDINSNEIK